MTKRQRWLSRAKVSILASSVATLVALCASAQNSASDVAVEVIGDVPGFAGPDELARFLAARMTGASPSWHFVAAAASLSKPVDRVEWTLKTVKVVWPGGTSRGVRLATVSRTYLKAEVRLYLHDRYQMTMYSQSGADDGPTELAEMAANVTRSLVASAENAKR
jgi:hypothetical protein